MQELFWFDHEYQGRKAPQEHRPPNIKTTAFMAQSEVARGPNVVACEMSSMDLVQTKNLSPRSFFHMQFVLLGAAATMSIPRPLVRNAETSTMRIGTFIAHVRAHDHARDMVPS